MEHEIIEDDEAIIMKCRTCGKFRDAIAFAPQLPKHLAPDGFIRCEGHHSPPAPLTYTVPSVLAPAVELAMLQGSITFGDIVYSGRMPLLCVRDQAHAYRLKRRKQIARRQKRAVFRHRKRGLA